MTAGADRVRFEGDDLVGIGLDDIGQSQALAASLRESGDWLDAVAGMQSCVAQFDAASIDPSDAHARFVRAVKEMPAESGIEGEVIELPVCYGGEYGPELDVVCDRLGIDAERFVELHTSRAYPVELTGFTPGFAYIGGFETAADVARLETPRQRVEAGSVGVVGGRTGVYALAGPGGWPVVGRTPMRLFKPAAENPFLLRFGVSVRFRAIDADEFETFGGA